MTGMTAAEIAAAAGGTLLRGDGSAVVTHISIDSRDVPVETLFVPVIGEHTDAHRFLPQVAEKKAAAAFTSEGDVFAAQGTDSGSMALIGVADTVGALQKLAVAYRNKQTLPLVGITGSVGKTTTKEMIAAALSAGFRVYRTPANHNSQIGVPLTILGIAPEAQIGVIEMGMSIPGEMTKLSAIVRPDCAVFTNIGVAHIRQLGTQENIREEKMHIRDFMKPGSTLFLNGDDPLLKDFVPEGDFRTVLYGTGENCGNRAVDIVMENGCARFTAVVGTQRIPVKLRVYGAHQVLNAMAALSVAAAFGTDLHKAAEKLGEFGGYRHRQQILKNNGITVIDDSYNASPDSMKAALDILRTFDSGRRIAVLADMKELGEEAAEMHRQVGRYLGERYCADILYLLGELAPGIGKGAEETGTGVSEIRLFTDRDELEKALREEVKPGDTVLFKGSNSMKLSDLADRMSGNAE